MFMNSHTLTAKERINDNVQEMATIINNVLKRHYEYAFSVNGQDFVVAETVDQGWCWEMMDDDGACLKDAAGSRPAYEAQQAAVNTISSRISHDSNGRAPQRR